MDAVVVYQIVKALPSEEQNRLLNMLQKDLQATESNTSKPQKMPLVSDEEATMFLIKNVFTNTKNS